MARREQIPAADVLFRPPVKGEPVPPPVRKVPVTVYMPPNMVADLDDTRAELRRSAGETMDRGRLVRAAIQYAQAHTEDWIYTAMKETD